MKQLKILRQITKRDSLALDKFLSNLAPINVLTPTEEVELIGKYRQGDEEAGKTLVRSNFRFVVSVAKHYQNQGLEFPDLIVIGISGLYKGLKSFDPSKGFRFISYTVWWIRQSISQAVSDLSAVRTPVNYTSAINRTKKEKADLVQELRREPTPGEIVERIEKKEQIKATLKARFERNPTEDEVAEAMKVVKNLEVKLKRSLSLGAVSCVVAALDINLGESLSLDEIALLINEEEEIQDDVRGEGQVEVEGDKRGEGQVEVEGDKRGEGQTSGEMSIKGERGEAQREGIQETKAINQKKKKKITDEDVIKHLQTSPKLVSLEGALLNSEDNTLLDTLVNEDEVNVEEDLIKDSLREVCMSILSGLSDRDREIIKWYKGLGEDRSKKSLEEIGSYLGLTRERVRQIIERIQRQLKTLCEQRGIELDDLLGY